MPLLVTGARNNILPAMKSPTWVQFFPIPPHVLIALPIMAGLSAAFAGSQAPSQGAEQGAGGGRPPLRQTLTLSGAYAASADASGDLGSGGISQSSFLVRHSLFMPLSREWFFRGGPAWQGFFFDSDNSLVPNQLHEFAFDIGFGRKLSEKWTALGWISPALASDLDALDPGDFNLTGVLGVMWKASDTFEMTAGARFALHSNYPVLPAAGFKWKFAPSWELNLMAPQPELVWSVTDSLKLSAGAAIAGGAFRVGDDFGKSAGRPDLAGEWVGFREIRTFSAVEAGLSDAATLRVEAGWMAGREFEFVDSDDSLDVDGGFYGSVSLKLAF